jgi:hypothetical protein
MHDISAKGADGLLRGEHELKTGGETHETTFFVSTVAPGCQMPTSNRCIKVNLDTTLSKHYQIPRFGANSDSPSSIGSFSKCGPWTLGSSACNRQEDETNKGKSGIKQCVKKKMRRETNMVCVERLAYARSPDGGACSRSRTVGWPPGARPTLAKTS